jgi:hypothetical protein
VAESLKPQIAESTASMKLLGGDPRKNVARSTLGKDATAYATSP